jgi:hypothetical protein
MKYFVNKTEIKDNDIILVRNTKGINIIDYIFYFIIRLFVGRYNHCILIKKFNDELYVCESKSNGFNITKKLNKFFIEQNQFKRDLLLVRLDTFSQQRFDEILGNKYRLSFLNLNDINTKKTNCYQSIAHIFNIKPKDLFVKN